MKRYLIGALAIITLLSFSGCGSTSKNDNINSQNEQITADDLGANMSEEEKNEAASKDIQFECDADGTIIRGSIRMPENYTEGSTYPVVIMSHGIISDRDQTGLFIQAADILESKGIVSVRFDFDGNGVSDGSLKTNSIKTECNDLKSVLEYVKKLDYVNTEKINLLGFSMGGAVTSLVAGEVSEDINSVVLWAPAAVLIDNCEEGLLMDTKVDVNNLPDEIPMFNGTYIFGKPFFEDAIGLDIYGIAEKYEGPVLIVQGDCDGAVPMSYSEKYDEVYANSQLKVIKNGEHVFSGDALTEALDLTTQFFEKNN